MIIKVESTAAVPVSVKTSIIVESPSQFIKKARMRLPPAHILICRTDNIGDVVLTLPMTAYLKEIYPGVKIDFLCRAYAAPVVAHCRFVNHVVALESLKDPAAFFSQAKYDTVIFAFPNRRLAQAAKKAGVRNRVGTSHRLFHWFTCNRLAHFSRVKSTLHEAQLNFALLRPLGIDFTPTLAQIPPLYGLTASARADVAALFTSPTGDARFNLILHPKSNGNGREWPLGHYTALARLLEKEPAVQIWLTGSAAEGVIVAQQAPALLDLPNVRNLCGTFDLDGLTALIGACDGLIASGTGPLHMAAALGRPTLGLFPPIKPIDPARWGALGLHAQSLCAAVPCGACQQPDACTCMQKITPEQVQAVVLQWQRQKISTLPATTF
jgi:ADP-heptose:LPS heptosyltransferase